MAAAAVLCIGTELTRGELFNSNATWLAEALTSLGFEVFAIDCTDDDPTRIERALERLGLEHDVLVCTGGLGPTTDDMTTACVAHVLGVPLQRDETSLAVIRERMSRIGRTMATSNEKQADFPSGAAILPNPNGTAPGFSIRIHKALAFFMPGVPLEMKAMFEHSVVPQITPLLNSRHHQILYRTFGLPESEVNDRLAGIEERFAITIGYRATLPEIEVKVLARAATLDEAQQLAERAATEVRARLGEYIFGLGKARYPEAVGNLLRERKLSLSVAESCTGGMVAELMTASSGASDYFIGGIVAYSNSVKVSELAVGEALLETHGAVSEQVALAMARGVRERLRSDIGLSLTGIAGPSGGSPNKPVGLVHYAVVTKDGESARHHIFLGNREQIRRRAAVSGLHLVRSVVLRGHRQS